MKRPAVLISYTRLIISSVAGACLACSVNAERVLYDSFETPVVLSGATDPSGWTAPGHPSYFRVANESGQNWSTPYGEQGCSTYSNGAGTKTVTFLPSESGEYVVSVNITSKANIGEYRIELWSDHPFLGRQLEAFKTGDTDGSKDMSYSDTLSWYHDPSVNFLDGAELEVRIMQDPNRTNWRHTPIWDNIAVDWIPDVDNVGPELVDIVDDRFGAPMAPNSTVTYTVTFNEPMDPATVDVTDFGNASSSTVIINSVTPTADDTQFLVAVTPTDEGLLRLRINQFAVLEDANENGMDTSTAIQDNVTITVDATSPILIPSDFVDDVGGGPIAANTLVTYTVTFSKDMDAATVTAADFANNGTAPITIGAIAESVSTPGEFTVEVTPTGDGTLNLMVPQGVALEDVDGELLDTSDDISDDTTIIVDGTPPTLASVDITDDAGGSPVPVSTLITYDVFFSEDIDESTVDASDFGNAITTGNATFTIDSVEEASPGVFRVEITPTGSGDIQLQVNSGAVITDVVGNALNTGSAIIDDTVVTVGSPADPYDTWSGGLPFSGDDNGDGVADGLAWLLGSSGPSENASQYLPTAKNEFGDLVIEFRCLKSADRGSTSIKVQFSPNLGNGPGNLWTDNEAEVPDVDSTVNGIVFDVTDEGDVIFVSAAIPGPHSGKAFARVTGSQP